MSEGPLHAIAALREAIEQTRDFGVVDRAIRRIAHQILLADIGDVALVLVLGEEVVKGLIAIGP